jgi:predicted unusual protein kinase regulating ubiquinone biosynthesis (AarF/ABC1/UbiB family)
MKWSRILGVSLLGATGVGAYQYQHNHSFNSLCNLAYAGAHMAAIYKYSSDPIEHKNERAGEYLRDALKKNGGIYLKLGQLIATLDVIVPDEYRIVMGSLTR